jgi:hypothetical protein
MTNQLQEKMLVGYYKSLILILFFATILCSCETSSDQLQSESFDLKISKCSPLQIDLSYNFNNSTGFSQSNIDGEKIVAHLSNHHLYAFSAKTGELLTKYAIPREGPQSVGEYGMFSDAIPTGKNSFWFANYNENKISAITPEQTTVVVDMDEDDAFRLMTIDINPPLRNDQYTLFGINPKTPDMPMGRKTYVAVDNTSGSHRYVIDANVVYPSAFSHGNLPYLYWPSVTYNPKKRTYVVSFPVSHDLFEYNQNFELINTHKVYHKEIGEIPYYEGPRHPDGPAFAEEGDDYFFSINKFKRIFYLPEVKRYVRLAMTVDPVSKSKKHLIFVYDDQLVPTNTIELDNSFYIPNTFSSGAALHLLNEAAIVSEKEGEIPYSCIDLTFK